LWRTTAIQIARIGTIVIETRMLLNQSWMWAGYWVSEITRATPANANATTIQPIRCRSFVRARRNAMRNAITVSDITP